MSQRYVDLAQRTHAEWTAERDRHVNGPAGLCLECARDGRQVSAEQCRPRGEIIQVLMSVGQAQREAQRRLGEKAQDLS